MAAFAGWHERHADASRALGGEPAIVTHAAFETYSALTRIAPPERAQPEQVMAYLDGRFADRWLGLSAPALKLALQRLEELGIAGGATYDGLIAMTAAAKGATLVTLDRRALQTYAHVGVEVDYVG